MTYLASSGLCIGAIGCLANQNTARLGNALGIIGVSGGIAATLGLINGDAALYTQVLGESAPTSPSPACGLRAEGVRGCGIGVECIASAGLFISRLIRLNQPTTPPGSRQSILSRLIKSAL